MEDRIPLGYDELRRIAARKLRDERDSHTLSATALVHEAWIELSKLNRIQWRNRSHYLAIAAQAMRRILIDYAVARRRQKRGGGSAPLHLEGDVWAVAETRGEELLALDEALARLAVLNERQAHIVEQRFYGHDGRRNRRGIAGVAGHSQEGMGHGASLAEPGAARVSGSSDPIDANRWQQIQDVLADVIDSSPSQRDALLDRRCADDPSLRREVESLLIAHEQAGFVDELTPLFR